MFCISWGTDFSSEAEKKMNSVWQIRRIQDLLSGLSVGFGWPENQRRSWLSYN